MSKRHRIRRLLAPTAGFRKAIVVLLLGVLAFAIGSALSLKVFVATTMDWLAGLTDDLLLRFVDTESIDQARHLLGGALLFLGLYLVFHGGRAVYRQFTKTLFGEVRGGMLDAFRRKVQLVQGPRVVALGGGTGLSTLLRGLKQHSSNITAIVTVTDDGGSSGRLKQEKGIIPPGDIRNCMVALAEAEKSMTDLFQHRFTHESGSLSGHSVGNLLIAALVDQAHGDFEKAVETASDVLNIRGRVIPATLSNVRLRAVMEDGTEICGETKIVESARRIRRIFLDPEDVEAYHVAIDAIRDADLICIGPGSVYTSVIPNLLVRGIAEALQQSTAKKVYVCNVMTQKGESDSFTASEHITSLQANVESKIFDYVVVNTGIPSEQTLKKYRTAGQHLVDADIERIKSMGYKVIAGDFMNESDLVRHDPMRLAARLISLVYR